MEDVIVIESSKEEGELSDDEDDTNDDPQNSTKMSKSIPSHQPRTHPSPRHKRDKPKGHNNTHSYKLDKQVTSKLQPYVPTHSRYDSVSDRKRDRLRDKTRNNTPPKDLHPYQTIKIDNQDTTTRLVSDSNVKSNDRQTVSTKENTRVQSLLEMDIPVPAAYWGVMPNSVAPPPPPPPLPEEPPPDKPEPPPLSLPNLPRQRPTKTKANKPIHEPASIQSPPAGDVEDTDYIDLLLEYQEIKKELDILNKVETSSTPASQNPVGQGDVVNNAQNTKEEIQERSEDEENNILQLRLNALKSVASDSPESTPIKPSDQVRKTAKPGNKRTLPFAPRNFDSLPSSRRSKFARREESTILRERTGQYYWDVPRSDGRAREKATAERRRQDRKRERRRRDEDKRRTEKRRLDEECEANRRRLEVQKIVTLDDPKEQYKRFMELVAGVEQITRSEASEKVTVPQLADNYEQVAMDLDSEDGKSDAKADDIPDIFNLPKLDPDIIPGLDTPYSDLCSLGDLAQHEPAFTSDLMSFGPASTGFHETLDSPMFVHLYASPPSKQSQTIQLSPVEPPELPECTEAIPGLGWSNEPSKSQEIPEGEMASLQKEKGDGDAEKDKENTEETEEDEEVILRAKLLKSLFMRKKVQEHQAASSSDSSPQPPQPVSSHPVAMDTSLVKPSAPAQLPPASSTTVALPPSPVEPQGEITARKCQPDVKMGDKGTEPLNNKSSNKEPMAFDPELKLYRKAPRHDPVVIRIGNESDSDGEKEGTNTSDQRGSSGAGIDALLGNLDSFIKEARMSVEAKPRQASDSEKASDKESEKVSKMETPEVVKVLPRTKVEEYKKLKEILSKRTGSGAKMSGPASPVDRAADEQTNDARTKENLQKELRQKVVLLQLELVQQKHSLRINKNTLSGLKHEIFKKRAVLRMGEDHVQKLREQLAAAEKIVQSNRIQLNVFNEQAQDSQAHVDERMARVQALEAQLSSVGRQAYGAHFTPNMAAGALLRDPLAEGNQNLSVTIGKNQKGARQVVVPPITALVDSNSASPIRKVVVVKKKPVPAKSAIRKVKLGAVKAVKTSVRATNVRQPTKSLKTQEDIVAEKARLMQLEKKYAAMIEEHKARQQQNKGKNDGKPSSNEKKSSMPVPELPSPSSTMWKSLRRRSGSHVRRDSEPEHVHTEEVMKVDVPVDDHNPPKLRKQPSLLDGSQSTKPSLGSNHDSREVPSGRGTQQANQDAPSDLRPDACYRITNKASFNKALKSYRSSLQHRFKESVTSGTYSSKSSLHPKLRQFPAASDDESTSTPTPSQAQPPSLHSTDLQTDFADENETSSLRDYSSPLLHLRSYRLCPYYRTKEKLSLVSHTYSHKINPYKPLCQFDVTGKCNDEKCIRQHSVHYKLSSAELLKDFSSYQSPMITDDKGKHNDELDAFVDNFSKTHNKKFTLDQQCLLLVSKVNKAANLEAPHTMVTELRQLRPRQKLEKNETSVDVPEMPKQKPGGTDDVVLLETDVRYCSSAATCWDDMEAAVLSNLTDVDKWIKLAYHKLYAGQNRDENLDQALNVLSRGLESNTDSSQLWLHYLGLYSRRPDSSDVTSLYQQALSYAPSYQLYWKYMESCTTTRDRSDVCHQVMKFLLSDLCTETPGEKSHHLLEIIIHQVSLYINIGLQQEGLQLIQCAVEISPDGTPPDPWYILIESDRLLLMLTHVHVQQFHSLPQQLFDPSGKHPGRIVNKAVWSLPWSTLFQGLGSAEADSASQVEVLCCSAQAALHKWIDQLDEALKVKLCPEGAVHRDLVVLHENVVNMYLAAGRCRMAQDYCVEMLSDDHVQKEMYIKLIECAASNRNETPNGVKCWYKQAILHLPTCAKVYRLAADYEIQWGDEDLALELLEQCALAMFVTDTATSTSCDPNLLFCKLLKQSIPLDFEPSPLKPVVTPAEIDAQQAELWNCYCLLLDLQGCPDQASEAFESAVLALQGTDRAASLWIRYLRHEHKLLLHKRGKNTGDSFREFSSLVARCLRTLPCRAPMPHAAVLTWLDYSSHTAVLDTYLATVPEGGHVAVYQGLLQEYPSNIPLLLRAVNHLQKSGHVALSRGYCVTSLMDHPRCLAVWNIYISLLQKENNILEMRTAYTQATLELPRVANLWKDFAQFELLHGGEDRVKDLLDKCHDPDMHLADWIQNWAGGKVKVTSQTDKEVSQKNLSETIQKNLASIRKETEAEKAKNPSSSHSIDVLQTNRDYKTNQQANLERKEKLQRQSGYIIGKLK